MGAPYVYNASREVAWSAPDALETNLRRLMSLESEAEAGTTSAGCFPSFQDIDSFRLWMNGTYWWVACRRLHAAPCGGLQGGGALCRLRPIPRHRAPTNAPVPAPTPRRTDVYDPPSNAGGITVSVFFWIGLTALGFGTRKG